MAHLGTLSSGIREASVSCVAGIGFEGMRDLCEDVDMIAS